jgi:catechol 2,3-dioxygenase-like lactoylglutathione lyase family enzyme
MRPSRQYTVMIVLLLVLAPAAFAPEARPNITGLCFVRFQVSSLGEAGKFYADELGLLRTHDCWGEGSEDCFFLTPYQDVEIVKPDTAKPTSFLDEIGIWTSDSGSLRGYLLARGLKVGEIVSRPDGLQYFDITDPEQHRLRFLSKKGAPHILSPPQTQVSSHMIHTGFIVRDRAATEHFYKDILGFHPYWHGGMKEGQDDWVSLQVPDGRDWIEFMVNVSADADQRLRGIMNHIALGVGDIHAAREKLVKNGWKPSEEPKIGRDGKWQLNLYDPDLTRVEFMEFSPVQKPCCSEFTGPHPIQ